LEVVVVSPVVPLGVVSVGSVVVGVTGLGRGFVPYRTTCGSDR
jgi:hypothetical protein